jgi:predicted amidohydrolase YtcJ
MQGRLRAHAAEHAGASWVIGILWAQQELGRYPTADDLDAAVADRPAFLWRACWHIGVANRAGLA